MLAQLGEKLADAEGSFFLDCRKAGQLLGVSHKTAWKWMHALWTMTEQGQFRGNANQWKTISRSL